MSAELVVLVDEAGNAVGSAQKSTTHHAQTPLHLAFSCYVFDHAGRLLLPQRAHEKPTFPGVWTNGFSAIRHRGKACSTPWSAGPRRNSG